MNNRTIQRVVILGALAILLVLGTQTYLVTRTWNLNERNFQQSVTIALQNVAKQLSSINNESTLPTDLIKPLSSNSYAVNVNSQINAINLDYYLRRNFEANSINEDWDYAIYDCHDEKYVYGKYVPFSTSSVDSLGVNKDFDKLAGATYYFTVRFPKRSSNLLGNMGVMIGFSIISLLTVMFFIYSMLIILRQKRLSELQKDFINNMTHEFKTPISTIKVAADVFASNPFIQGDARLSKYAQIMREQNNRLNTQVEKVLQITRIDKNTLDLNTEIINLHELLDTVLPSIQVKVEGMNGILEQRLRAKQPYIKADSLHLTNIIHNLLDNAMKYCKDGKPEVIVITEDTEKNIRLMISDRGIGIDKEHHKKIFQRFYRVPTGNIHNVKGFGLGLYYVKNIVQAHGWSIDIASETDSGTSIIIDIPKVINTNIQAKQQNILSETL
jgi:two-component system, OmpR family, phosphate regulon sensor histidine kinase PhoR